MYLLVPCINPWEQPKSDNSVVTSSSAQTSATTFCVKQISYVSGRTTLRIKQRPSFSNFCVGLLFKGSSFDLLGLLGTPHLHLGLTVQQIGRLKKKIGRVYLYFPVFVAFHKRYNRCNCSNNLFQAETSGSIIDQHTFNSEPLLVHNINRPVFTRS